MLRRSDDSHDGALRMGGLEVATLGIQPLSEAHRGRRFETCQSMKALGVTIRQHCIIAKGVNDALRNYNDVVVSKKGL